ncbi:hypothetical protein AVEN_143303-1 [Araneus ventricosus]|uniref:Uncharacterized protein n=1 Tax=Araneus ventricosus TaxID=182803 RepID=A0A4Y2ADP8_ARAVE|nr:hypothetical protein AVEN_143303-1 [Araneus ventricosus]
MRFQLSAEFAVTAPCVRTLTSLISEKIRAVNSVEVCPSSHLRGFPTLLTHLVKILTTPRGNTCSPAKQCIPIAAPIAVSTVRFKNPRQALLDDFTTKGMTGDQ